MKIPVEVENRVARREKIMDIQEKMDKAPGVMHGNCFPLQHQFGEGLYVRSIFMPKGALIVSKIHKYAHPYFCMKGSCSVLTDEGVLHIKAPFHDITKPGTKRVLYIHEDCVWATVHSTKETDLKKIEDEIISKEEIPHMEVAKINEFLTEARKHDAP